MPVFSSDSAGPLMRWGARSALSLGLFWGLLAVAPAAAQTPAARPDPSAALLAGSCLSCHSGVGAGGIPIIAKTLTKAEFLTAMQEFRSNAREATIMTRIARGYSDADLAILAAYFAK
ncbi:MAG: c-type cytochrome [Elsteraceae bacterium]